MLTTAQLALAISLAAGHNVSAVQAEKYAEHIEQKASEIELDPMIMVSIISHESLFVADSISKDYNDIGLCQIRAKHYRGRFIELLDPFHNMDVCAFLLNANKKYCRKLLGRDPTIPEILASFTGSNGKCRETTMAKQIESYAECLKQAVLDGEAKDVCRKKNFTPLCKVNNELVECNRKYALN